MSIKTADTRHARGFDAADEFNAHRLDSYQSVREFDTRARSVHEWEISCLPRRNADLVTHRMDAIERTNDVACGLFRGWRRYGSS